MANTTTRQYGMDYDIQTVGHITGQGPVLGADESIAHWRNQKMRKHETNEQNQQKCKKCGRVVGCDYRGRKHKCGCLGK